MGFFDRITLPDGTQIVSLGGNHIDTGDAQGRYSVRLYRHPDGYDCNRVGVPIWLPNGALNRDALKRAEVGTTDADMVADMIVEAAREVIQ